MAADEGFLSRWSRRKVQVQRHGTVREDEVASAASDAAVVAPAVAAAPVVPAQAAAVPPAVGAEAQRPEPPPPTLDDVAKLDPRHEGIARFVARGVQPDVKNAALKKLFADPRFNVMDGLDTYIDDYTKPDPLPRSMLKQMAQGQFLGLFEDEPKPKASIESPRTADDPHPSPLPQAGEGERPLRETAASPPHEDADLQLQPDDAARRAGAEAHARGDAGREH